MDGQTDRHYQTYYLPASQLIIKVAKFVLSFNLNFDHLYKCIIAVEVV